MYYYGEGVAEDVPEALALFRKAAEQGHVESMVNIGLILAGAGGRAPPPAPDTPPASDQGAALGLEQGSGVAVDHQSAAAWLGKAAALGDDTAQWLLGRLYYDGHVVPSAGDRYREAVKVRCTICMERGGWGRCVMPSAGSLVSPLASVPVPPVVGPAVADKGPNPSPLAAHVPPPAPGFVIP